MLRAKVLIIFLVLFFFIGCNGSGGPSKSEAKDAIEKKYLEMMSEQFSYLEYMGMDDQIPSNKEILEMSDLIIKKVTDNDDGTFDHYTTIKVSKEGKVDTLNLIFTLATNDKGNWVVSNAKEAK